MAAIGRSAFAGLLLFAAAASGRDTPRQRVSQVAMALSVGNAAEAISIFDKSFSDYENLRDYFGGLTSAYQITNQLQVVEEDDGAQEATLTLKWTLTLSDAQNSYTESREETINVRLALKNGNWKITQFAPIEFFNPQQSRARK